MDMEDDLSTLEVQGTTQTGPLLETYSLPALFLIAEAFIAATSIGFIGIGVITGKLQTDAVFLASPPVVLTAILIVSAVKGIIGYSLLSPNPVAWAAALVALGISLLATLMQLTGLFTSSSLWWLLVRFESGGNLAALVSLFGGGSLLITGGIAMMGGVYVLVARRLYRNRETHFGVNV